MVHNFLLRIFVSFCFFCNVFATQNWGWRNSLDVQICTDDKRCALFNSHQLHEQRYREELRIAPYLWSDDNLPNICLGNLTVLMQVGIQVIPVTVPIQESLEKYIIFCSQKDAKLQNLILNQEFNFAPKKTHPRNIDLQPFLEHYDLLPKEDPDTSDLPLKKSSRSDQRAKQTAFEPIFKR